MEASQRPRERLLAEGADALSDAELLAVLLRTGRHGHGAVSEAHGLLAEAGGLAEVARLEPAELMARPGIGPAKAASLVAALELARRLARVELKQAESLDCPDRVGGFLMRMLKSERSELFGFLSLDGRHRLLRGHEISRGTRNQAPVDPADMFRRALLDGAVCVVVYHNHPSGDLTPSADDVVLTRRLVETGRVVGVEVSDHIVVAGARWLSLRRTNPELFVGGRG